jgi:hypothetical protein
VTNIHLPGEAPLTMLRPTASTMLTDQIEQILLISLATAKGGKTNWPSGGTPAVAWV